MAQRRNRGPEQTPVAAFLNVPYDDAFGDLFLAYIAGLTAFGLTPRATVEIPGGARRLDRILELIASCRYSFHDLSRVELDQHRPATPRFNMPFELGLTVTWEQLKPGRHTWFVLETRARRIAKSLSDLAGTDENVHGGKPGGVFRELGNALVRVTAQPTTADFQFIFKNVKRNLPELLRRTGGRSIFDARVFKEAVVAARALAQLRIGG